MQPSLAGLRVLLADDNAVNRELLAHLLRSAGCEVAMVADGCEAVAAEARQAFDAIILDVRMPRLDGLQAARAVRAREATSGGHTLILALTADGTQEDVQRCLEAGMDDLFSKPVDPDALAESLARRALTGPKAAQGQAEDPILDHEAALASVEGDLILLDEIKAIFIEDLAGRLSDLEAAVRAADQAAAVHAAHTIKGAAATLGARRLSRSAQRMEAAARAGELDRLEGMLAEVRLEGEHARRALQSGPATRAA